MTEPQPRRRRRQYCVQCGSTHRNPCAPDPTELIDPPARDPADPKACCASPAGARLNLAVRSACAPRDEAFRLLRQAATLGLTKPERCAQMTQVITATLGVT